MHTDDLADVIAQLDRIDELARWERRLIESLDELEPARPKLGINLAEKHGDIRKLLGKFGTRACVANGWDFEELLSDIYLRIAASNVGSHPFDPRRSSLGTYVVMQIHSTITNRWRRETQRKRLAPMIAIDDVELRGMTWDLDASIDAERAIGDLVEREPVIVSELLRTGGAVHKLGETAKERRLVAAVRGEMVSALS